MNATRAAVRIEGRGPVALALALFLAPQGFKAGSLSLDPVPADLPPPLASRSLALSLGSWQLLSHVALPHPPRRSPGSKCRCAGTPGAPASRPPT